MSTKRTHKYIYLSRTSKKVRYEGRRRTFRSSERVRAGGAAPPPRPPAPPPPRSRRAGGTGITALEGRIRALQGLSRALEGRIVALHGPSMALQGGRERAGGTGRAPSGPPRKKKKKTDPGPTGPPHWRRGRPVRQLPGGAGPRRHWAWRLTAAQRGHGVGGGRVGRGRARWAWATCRAVSGARRPRRVGGGAEGDGGRPERARGAPRAGWGGARGALGPPAVQRADWPADWPPALPLRRPSRAPAASRARGGPPPPARPRYSAIL